MTNYFPDISSPPDRLRPPGNYDGRAKDAISLPGELEVVDWLWQKVTGWSLMERLIRPFTGNWTNLFTLRDIWNNIGDAIGDVNDNLNNGALTLGPQWNGNAASAFEAYMSRMALTLVSERDYAHYFADKVNEVGEVFEDGVEILGNVLDIIAGTLGPKKLEYAIPWWGQKQLVKDVKALIEVADDVTEVADKIEAVIDILKSLDDIARANIPDAPRVNSVPDNSYGGPENPGI